MSFKRDGNDSGMLSVLQKRRIKDLLVDDIPEDEAKLLSNGRFACLVCSSHPIFDNVNMLCVHRKGKKHQAGAEIHERKKKELKQLIAKRRHDHFINTGSISIDVAAHSRHDSGITSASPYDSRMKKKGKTGDRQLRVNLQQTEDEGSRSNNDLHSNTASSKKCTPHHSSYSHNISSTPWQTISRQQFQGPVKHDSQLKNIFCKKKNEKSVRLQPYYSKHRTDNNSIPKYLNGGVDLDSSCSSNSNNIDCGNGSNTSCNTTHFTRNSGKLLENLQSISFLSSRGHCLLPPPPVAAATTIPPPAAAALPSPQKQQPSQSSASPRLAADSSPLCPNNLSLPSTRVSKSGSTSSSQNGLQLKYRQLQGSGWKRDWDGKWIKDEEAEFDSDEEPPDFP